MSSFKDLINSPQPVLVDFFAEWCGPCKTMAPILKETKSKLGDAVRIVKIDVDKNQQVAATYNVQSVPTLILFKNGQPIWRQAGVVPAAELVRMLSGRN